MLTSDEVSFLRSKIHDHSMMLLNDLYVSKETREEALQMYEALMDYYRSPSTAKESEKEGMSQEESRHKYAVYGVNSIFGGDEDPDAGSQYNPL
jgi:hypothetical protein